MRSSFDRSFGALGSGLGGGLVGTSRERGFSLVVSLMMLLVIIILGLSASQMSINEERGSRNTRDRQIAFQAAEAALKDAEYEINGATSPVCNVAGQISKGRQRPGTQTCFNESNYYGYALGCSPPPNAGLCVNNPALPAYLDYNNVDFLKDASGASSATMHTVAYGTYTGRTYGSQLNNGALLPVSAYPPRYIIEAVPKNTSVDGSTISAGGRTIMWRITAMGFGASSNAQVVLQAIVATAD